MSIGGEKGEPAYLIPSFKGGKKLKDPVAEFKKTGEHLGGPFKTWQEAEKFGELRHKYVEKGQDIPTPLKTWGDMAMGGSLPGAVGFTYARTAGSAPSNGKYAKKTKASAQDGKQVVDNSVLLNFDTSDPAFGYVKESNFVNFDPKNFEGIKQNMARYMNSPLYMERLSKSIPDQEVAKDVQKRRLDNLLSVKLNPKTVDQGTYYNLLQNRVNLGANDFVDNPTIAHEVAHGIIPITNASYGKKNLLSKAAIAIGGLFQPFEKFTESELEKINRPLSGRVTAPNERYQKAIQEEHYAPQGSKASARTAAGETYGDLTGMRQLLLDNSITTEFGQELTPEMFQKALKNPKISNEPVFQRMKLKFKDEDIIKMNNEVAQLNNAAPLTQAQNGKEMRFYQQGLDFTPKTISKNGSVIKDDMGQWAHPGEITEIDSNDITMEGVDYPVLGISDTGDTKLMQPGENYKFKGKKVTEYPMAQKGISKAKKKASETISNLPIYSPDSRYQEYQDILPYWQTNIRGNQVEVDPTLNDVGAYYNRYITSPEQAYWRSGKTYINPSKFNPYDNEGNVLEHEVYHAGYNSYDAPKFMFDLLQQTNRDPQSDAHANRFPEQLANQAVARRDVLDEFDLPLNSVIPKDLSNEFLRRAMFTELRNPNAPAFKSSTREAIIGNKPGAFNDVINYVAPSKKENGGWLNKYTPKAQTGITTSIGSGTTNPTVQLTTQEDIKKAKKKADDNTKAAFAAAAKRDRQNQAYISKDKSTPASRAADEQMLIDAYVAEAQKNSPLAQTFGSLTPSGYNPEAGATAARFIGEANPIMSGVRMSRAIRDSKNNPYGIGEGKGYLSNILGTLGLVGDVLDIGVFGNLALKGASNIASDIASNIDRVATKTGTAALNSAGAKAAVDDVKRALYSEIGNPGTSTIYNKKSKRLQIFDESGKEVGTQVPLSEKAVKFKNSLQNQPVPQGATPPPPEGLMPYITPENPNPLVYSRSYPTGQSEIDWAKWNPEIPKDKKLLKEYHDIEEMAKATNTWMKNADGTPFTLPDGKLGTPEQFVQMQSKNFKKAFPEGVDITYRGDAEHYPALRPENSPFFGKSIFTANEDLARFYTPKGPKAGYFTPFEPTAQQNLENYIAKNFKPGYTVQQFLKDYPQLSGGVAATETAGLHQLAIPKTKNVLNFNAAGQDFSLLSDPAVYKKLIEEGIIPHNRPTKGVFDTDNIAEYIEKAGLDRAVIQNVDDGSIGTVLIHNQKPGKFAKSLRGNSGKFDMSNPDVYKALIPAIGVGALKKIIDSKEEKKNGGWLNKYK